ncbi:MAG: PAS domain S-box protein [Proteobacteria bacterium]|nr:PAS domain S-box protein [Pseudomonadota bacterium]
MSDSDQTTALNTSVDLGHLPDGIIDNLLEGCQLIGHDERFLYLNKTAARHGRKSMEDLMGRTLKESFPHVEDTPMYEVFQHCLKNHESQVMENEFTYPDGSSAWFELRFEPVPQGVFILSVDISHRKKMEKANKTMVDLLNLMCMKDDPALFLHSVVTLLKDWSGCEAVGIRIKSGDDFPYAESLGFTDQFLRVERCLCSFDDQGNLCCDAQGMPLLECMCGNIIQGRFDSSKPYFTEDGSFWSNCTSDFIKDTKDTVFKTRIRNYCNKTGYESIALIPMRSGEKTFGLLQFNDRKKGRFTKSSMAFYRWIADNISIYLAKKEAEEDVFRLNARLERLTQVVQDLSTVRSIGPIMDIVRSAAQELLQSDRATFVLKEGARYHYKQPDDMEQPIREKCLPMQQCISDWAIRRKERLIIEDVTLEKNIPDGLNRPVNVTSLIIIPIRIKDPVGAIGVYWIKLHKPTREDLQILQALVDSTSVAMERVRVYKDLERSQTQYRDLVENLNDVVYFLDSDNRFQYVSPAVKRFGFSPEDFIGNDFSVFVHPEDVLNLKKRIAGTLSGYEGTYEFRAFDKKGALLYIRVSSRAVFQGDLAVGITGVLIDMTEKHRAEEQLKVAQRMEAIGTLAGGIAHDFNNILSLIMGFTELSLEDVDEGSAIETYLQEIFSAGSRAKELVKQILAFASQSDEEIKPIMVSTIADEVLKFIRSSTPSTISIKHDISSNSLIMGNAAQIHQIFMNLCTNAIQAMEEEGGVLDIGLGNIFIDDNINGDLHLKQGPYLLLTVSDTGPGIKPDILSSVFQPYFTTKEVGKGSGMGLSIVHGIIESYGGKIKAESTPGHGAVFSIYLPVTDDGVIHPIDESEYLPLGSERILFVDDEEIIARMGSQILERLGYNVVTQSDSLEALSLFRKQPDDFDLVITDMTMPHMTGDKLAVELMKIRDDIPVILSTGYSHKISEEKARNIGVKAFVNKPILKADIANVIRKVLDGTKESKNA